MPLICYTPKKFKDDSLLIIEQADRICAEYQRKGYDLTLRQLYYQFVARDLIRNSDKEYKRLGTIINDARLAGLLDWDYIVDRTRNLRSLAHWENPAEIIEQDAQVFRMDRWANQDNYVEVWIEKDALVGVIERVCNRHDVPFFSCRGYTSQSEIWGAAQRLISKAEDGKYTTIIHLGDHDPSGIDMSRDILDRLTLFMEHAGHVQPFVNRIALNMDQVRRFDPPPNPAKITDTRAKSYIAQFGHSSWELDALNPDVIDELITKAIDDLRDDDALAEVRAEEARHRETLDRVSSRWEDVEAFVNEEE